MSEQPSKTPRTEAAILVGSNTLDQGRYVRAAKMAELEIELAEAKEQIANLQTIIRSQELGK